MSLKHCQVISSKHSFVPKTPKSILLIPRSTNSTLRSSWEEDTLTTDSRNILTMTAKFSPLG